MRKNTAAIVLASLLGTVCAISASAQVPTQRPGLDIYDDAIPPDQAVVYYDEFGRPVPGDAAGLPTTTLNQRVYGQDVAVGPVGTPQPVYEDFYVDDNAPGPENLAGGLSDFNSNTMTQAGDQLRGDYGGVDRAALPSGQVQEAWNRPFENMSQGQSAPGNIRYQWSSDLVMPVRLREGVITNLILPDWEEGQDVLIGDGATIEANIIRSNVIAVRSVSVGLDTSMTVIGGSGNVYTFYLRTEGRNSKVVTDFQVFVQAAPSKGSSSWFNDEHLSSRAGAPSTKPVDGATSVVGAADDEGQTSINLLGSASQGDEPVPVDRRIFNMKMYEVNEGDRIIAPDYVYTDGKFTYMHFASGITDRPVIRRIVDGVEGRVNARVTGRHSEIIVVEAVGDFILRSGTRSVCVVQVDDKGAIASH